MILEDYLSLTEAAKICGLTMQTIWRHCESGAIKSAKKAGRRFILNADLREWILSGGIKPVGQPRKKMLAKAAKANEEATTNAS